MKKNRIVIFGWADSVHVQRWCMGLSRRGFEIKLISVAGQKLDYVETVMFPDTSKLSYLKCIPEARREALKFKPELIHAHYAAGNGLLGYASKIHPMVTSVWGSDIDTGANSWFVNWIVKKVLQRSDRITVTSQYLKSKVEACFNGLNRPVAVIPFGIESPLEAGPVPAARPFKIIFLKDHKPVYGADILIKALAQVAREVPEVYLTIAGKENEYTGYLRELVREHELEKYVRFAGQISRENVYPFISEHHLMAMPSLSEGFGVAAVEASACSRAVIATNVGGIPEIIINGETGILVPPGDAKALADSILKLANDIDLCHNMGQAGHAYVQEHYQWEKSLDLMCELYEKAIYDFRQS